MNQMLINNKIKAFLFLLSLLFIPGLIYGQQSVHVINVNNNRLAVSEEFHQFTGTSPSGVKLSVNNKYFTKNSAPWFPLMGEFHYWRYPKLFWEEQLVKMKSCGIGIVSTYVYWGAHEKPEGTWKWDERLDLRHFIELCAKNGLYVWLRPGPYINADVRGGGFPDWIYNMKAKRTNDPVYLEKVKKYYDQVGEHTKGLYFSDGGPVIGIQLENEYASGEKTHIARLKEMALLAGMKPVYWSVTANTIFQFEQFEVLPLQGAYCYRGWEKPGTLTSDFLFAEDQWIMGMDLGGLYYPPDKYPRGTCEQGAGMQETPASRFIVEPQIIEAHAMNQYGRGINMLGYFMFQGGIQYPGTLVPETSGKHLPSGLVSYNYQAPLGEFGQMYDTYKYLKLHHLFLNDFGDRIVKTDVFRSDSMIKDPSDLTTLRYAARFDDKGQGFVFICNTQNYKNMSEKEVRFILNLQNNKKIEFPQNKTVIKNNKIAVWPVNFAYHGINIKYATAQVLCKIDAKQAGNLFLYETEGTKVEICIDGKDVKSMDTKGWKSDFLDHQYHLIPESLPSSITIQTTDKRTVTVTVLSRKDAKNAWKWNYNHQEYLVISDAGLMLYPDNIEFRNHAPEFSFKIFPDLKTGQAFNFRKLKADPVLFNNYSLKMKPIEVPINIKKESGAKQAVTATGVLPEGMNDVFLKINFTGDIITGAIHHENVADQLNCGKEWLVGLKRFLPLIQNNQGLSFETSGVMQDPNPEIKEIKIIPEYSTRLFSLNHNHSK